MAIPVAAPGDSFTAQRARPFSGVSRHNFSWQASKGKADRACADVLSGGLGHSGYRRFWHINTDNLWNSLRFSIFYTRKRNTLIFLVFLRFMHQSHDWTHWPNFDSQASDCGSIQSVSMSIGNLQPTRAEFGRDRPVGIPPRGDLNGASS
jgi:hypothetical protein